MCIRDRFESIPCYNIPIPHDLFETGDLIVPILIGASPVSFFSFLSSAFHESVRNGYGISDIRLPNVPKDKIPQDSD